MAEARGLRAERKGKAYHRNLAHLVEIGQFSTSHHRVHLLPSQEGA
jgi:hypothetical protein